MHIAWLGKKSPFCGNVTYGREITNRLLDRGHRVSFFHFAQEESQEEASFNCSEIFLPFLLKSQIYTIPSWKSSKVLIEALKELKPDLVHASLTLSPLDFRLPEICQELNLPLIATFHPGFDSKIRNLSSSTQYLSYQLYAPFLANYDQVVIFSHLQKDLLSKLGVKSEKLIVIPNGVDVEKYSPGTSYAKYEFNAKYLCVYQGRIAAEKNVESLLKAWKYAYPEMGKDSKLIIIGDGPLTPMLKPFYGEEDGIIWLGIIQDEQRRIQILRGADIFILPSLVEGLSLSLLEAMSCGVGCLVTDAGTHREVVEGGAGIVFSTQGVTTKLKTLLPIFQQQPEWAQDLGRQARIRVQERYTLNKNIDRLEALYAEVLDKRKFEYSTLS